MNQKESRLVPTRKTIGIIGYGNFSQLMCKQLAAFGSIIVYSRDHESGTSNQHAQFVTLDEVLQADIIIPGIPSQFFDEFFSEHGTKVRSDALVVDVCSVKVNPLKSLQKYLPETVQIIGTHPLFGPASVAKNGSLVGLRIAVCDVRTHGDTYRQLIDFFANTLQLHVIEKTPDQHDRDLAYVQGLSHYIGRVMDVMDIPQTELATFAYDDLLDMRVIQGSDSWELFMSIMHDNPYSMDINRQFHEACAALDAKIH